MVDDSPIINIQNEDDASKIISKFFETKEIEYFYEFLKYLSTKTYGNIKVEIKDIKDLFYQVNDKSVLEYLIQNDKLLDYRFNTYLSNNIATLKECIRLNYLKVLNFIEEDTLLLSYEGDMTLFDYLLNNNLLTEKIISSIWSYPELIDKIKNKDEKLLVYLNGFMVFKTKVGDLSTIEYLFQKGLVNAELIERISSDIEIYDLCIKYNRLDLLPHLQEGVLASEKDDKTILEHLLDNNIYPKSDSFYNKKINKILLNRKLYRYFINTYESGLLEKIDGEKTILEILLENGITPKTTFYTSKASIEIIAKYKRYDMFVYFKLDILTSLYNLNETYLDLLLNEKSAGLDLNLNDISVYSDNAISLAKFYIIVARHGFINHIDEISEYILTKNNGELLKELLNIDRDLTLNVIIPPRVKEKFNVASLLKMNGIEQKNIKIDLHSMDIVEGYQDKYNDEYNNFDLTDEQKSLIEEFRTLMLSDDLSDPKLVDAVITSYTYLIGTNNEYGIRELKKLIEIKKARKEFCIKKSKDGSYYKEADNSINLEDTNLNTLNHETGHALFHNLTNQELPSEYERLLFEIRNNPEVVKRIEAYSSKFQEIKKRVISFVDENYMSSYHISESELNSLTEYLNKQKEEHKKEYLEKGYEEETIDTLMNGIFSIEEYIEQDKRIKRQELIDSILRSEYGAFITIGDILDSIFIGKFRSNELLNKDGNVIEHGYGHGIAYYQRGINWSFDETMANYSAIIKSVDSTEIITYLKSIVGEKFINCIEDYYRNQISLSQIDLSKGDEKSL